MRIHRSLIYVLSIAGLLCCQQEENKPAEMTAENLGQIIRNYTEDVRQRGTIWEFRIDGIELTCISDPGNDRMRVLAAILPVEKLQTAHLQHMLEANYHSALDGRYCVANGVVYAAFIHPLSPLSEKEIKSALYQVSQLAKSFGTTYSSGVFSFGEPSQQT